MSWHLMYRLNLPLLERLFQEGPGRGKESYCKVERNATSSALLGGLKKAGQITFFFFFWQNTLSQRFAYQLFTAVLHGLDWQVQFAPLSYNPLNFLYLIWIKTDLFVSLKLLEALQKKTFCWDFILRPRITFDTEALVKVLGFCSHILWICTFQPYKHCKICETDHFH